MNPEEQKKFDALVEDRWRLEMNRQSCGYYSGRKMGCCDACSFFHMTVESEPDEIDGTIYALQGECRFNPPTAAFREGEVLGVYPVVEPHFSCRRFSKTGNPTVDENKAWKNAEARAKADLYRFQCMIDERAKE